MSRILLLSYHLYSTRRNPSPFSNVRWKKDKSFEEKIIIILKSQEFPYPEELIKTLSPQCDPVLLWCVCVYLFTPLTISDCKHVSSKRSSMSQIRLTDDCVMVFQKIFLTIKYLHITIIVFVLFIDYEPCMFRKLSETALINV